MSQQIIFLVVFSVITVTLLLWVGVPRLLNWFGLHPHRSVPQLDLSGKRALVIATSHGTLGDTGKATGVFASEMTAPYYAFLDSGMDVDIASIQGGKVPVEPQSLKWPVVSPPDKRFLKDETFKSKVDNSISVAQLNTDHYDIIFLAGGWGAAYDFAQSEALGQLISKAYANGAIVGGVCHGLLGLLPAQAPNGQPLVNGRRMTAVTDKQIRELGITHTPKHPERDLRGAGALFESNSAFRDFFASKVIVDGQIVSGQNQNDGTETAVKMMQTVLEKK